MTVTESQMAFGSWNLRLRSKVTRQPGGKPKMAAPQEILDLFTTAQDVSDSFLGHIIVTPLHYDKDQVDVLSLSRYTGVLRESKFTDGQVDLNGSGLIYWLGDLQQRGPIFESTVTLSNSSFVNGITTLLPDAIQAGNIVAEVGTQTDSYLFVTARAAIERWCSLFDAEYEINPQGELNAGTPASLYSTFNNPTTFILREGAGADPVLRPLPLASAALGGDQVNYATRVIALTQIEDEAFLEGSADLATPTSKRDLHGNLVEITDVNVESTLDAFNVNARAAARLAQISKTRQTFELSTERYDVFGTMQVGDSVWVWDDTAGLFDLTNEVEFRGQTYWPVKVRVVGLTWPVTEQMGVYFREPTQAGTIHDLTPYIEFEPNNSTQIEVGSQARSLVPPPTGDLGSIVGPEINPDTDPPPIPDAPTAVGNPLYVQIISDLGTGGVDFTLPHDMDHLEVHISTTSGFTPSNASYVGDIQATKSNLIANASAIRTFETPSEDQRYVRIIAVDKGGNLSPASSQTPVQAGLIDTAHITDLAVTNAKIASASISKLTTGDLTAAVATIASGGVLRSGTTVSPFHYWIGDDAGIRMYKNGTAAYTGGTLTVDLNISTGSAFFSGTVDASTITGSTITGGTIRTAASGQRVELSGSAVAHVFLLSGDAAENVSSSLRSFVSGTGATRRLYSILRGPTVVNDTNQMGVLQLWSDQEDGGESARAILKVSTNGSSSGSTATGAIVSLSSNTVDIASDVSGSQRLLLGGANSVLSAGTDIQLNAGDDLIIDAADIVDIKGGTSVRSRVGGVIKIEALTDRINILEGIAMNSNPIWGPTAGSVSRIESGSDWDIISETTSRVRSQNGNVLLRVGINTNEGDLVDNVGSTYRIFTADVVDACDEVLKLRRGDAPKTLDDLLGLEIYMASRASHPDDPPILAFAANKAPDYMVQDLALTTGEGKKQRQMKGSKPNASIAAVIAGIQEMYERLSSRMDEIEKER